MCADLYSYYFISIISSSSSSSSSSAKFRYTSCSCVFFSTSSANFFLSLFWLERAPKSFERVMARKKERNKERERLQRTFQRWFWTRARLTSHNHALVITARLTGSKLENPSSSYSFFYFLTPSATIFFRTWTWFSYF